MRTPSFDVKILVEKVLVIVYVSIYGRLELCNCGTNLLVAGSVVIAVITHGKRPPFGQKKQHQKQVCVFHVVWILATTCLWRLRFSH